MSRSIAGIVALGVVTVACSPAPPEVQKIPGATRLPYWILGSSSDERYRVIENISVPSEAGNPEEQVLSDQHVSVRDTLTGSVHELEPSAGWRFAPFEFGQLITDDGEDVCLCLVNGTSAERRLMHFRIREGTRTLLPTRSLALLRSDVVAVAPSGVGCAFVGSEATGASIAADPRLDVYWFDFANETTELISKPGGGGKANGSSYCTSVSADGNWVAFESEASNLIEGDANEAEDVFLWSRVSKGLTLVSRTRGGQTGNGISRRPMISLNSDYVVFDSSADDLTASPPEAGIHSRGSGIYRFDRRDNSCLRINGKSVGDGSNWSAFNGGRPYINSDGQLLLYFSDQVGFDISKTREYTLYDCLAPSTRSRVMAIQDWDLLVNQTISHDERELRFHVGEQKDQALGSNPQLGPDRIWSYTWRVPLR